MNYGSIIGNIALVGVTVGVAAMIAVDVVATNHRRQIEARRARNRDAGSFAHPIGTRGRAWTAMKEALADGSAVIGCDMATPSGGVTGSFQINRSNAVSGGALDFEALSEFPLVRKASAGCYGGRDVGADNPLPPVDFAALRARPIVEYDAISRPLRTRSVSINANGSVSLRGDTLTPYARTRSVSINANGSVSLRGDTLTPYAIVKHGGKWWLTKNGARLRSYTRKYTAVVGADRANAKHRRKVVGAPPPALDAR